MSSIRRVDLALHNTTHKNYDVSFYSDIIHTTVTHTPSIVDNWFSNLHRVNHNPSLLVGLDVEWLPNTNPTMNNPVAVLQLCVATECLVFQIIHAPFIPQSLVSFLANENHTFLGVGVGEDVEKLMRDYSLRVAKHVDLRSLAGPCLENAGLQTLAMRVLLKVMEKPKRITRSRWNEVQLSEKQVEYACLDAFVSFEIGSRLYSRNRSQKA